MKPLRILLGNNTLSLLAGSETWTRTLALQLQKAGHTVECFALSVFKDVPSLGAVAQDLERVGISCFDDIPAPGGIIPWSLELTQEHAFEYDVIIANHNHVARYLRSRFPRTPIISTIHGILHKTQDANTGEEVVAPEHPALDAGVSEFVSVSEETQEKLRKEYNIDSTIIRNFFDTDFFKARRRISKKPKQFLFNTNYNTKDDEETNLIREVARHYGAKLAAVGMNFNMSNNVMQAIEESDIVVGMGRSVLEGMCAGRLAICHGRWGTAGVIHQGNLEACRAQSFSGRNANGVFYTKEQLIEEIDRFYNPEHIKWGMKYVRADHNVVYCAEAYVRLARSLLGQDIVPAGEKRIIPFRRARDVAKTS